MLFSSPALTVALSTSTMSRRKSFIFGPVTAWKRNSSRLTRQPRSVSDKGLPAEQPKQKYPHRSPISVKNRSSPQEGFARFYLALATDRFLLCRSFWIRKSWGALTIYRRQIGSFAPEVVNLLQTFATQSVLAIQNARLFREIEDKS